MRDARSGIPNRKSLALIGSASTQSAECGPDVEAEALSITRLEGSRWRGGRLWSWNGDRRACDVAHVTVGAGAATGRALRVGRTASALSAAGADDRSMQPTNRWLTNDRRRPAARSAAQRIFWRRAALPSDARLEGTL